jgi:deoxycytidylate deaminase
MKYYSLLKKLSLLSDHSKHMMSCIIVKQGRIIGKGFNTISTHPESKHNFKCRHAEFNAFISAQRNIKGSTVYVFRENKNGIPSIAKPCSSCHALLVKNGAKLVVYSFEGSYKEEKLK